MENIPCHNLELEASLDLEYKYIYSARNTNKANILIMEEKLIEAVRMHPCLFDKSSSLFRNKYLKDKAWLAVAAATGEPEESCRTRWKSLRDRFVREKSGNKQSSGSAAEEKSEWCYMEALEFLSKHVALRKTTSNFDWCSDDQPSGSKAPPTQNKNEERYQDLYDSECSEESPKPSKPTKRQRLSTESHERLNRICGTIETVISEKRDKAPSRNSAFLEILDEYLKKKPEELQDRLKIEILVFVQNANV